MRTETQKIGILGGGQLGRMLVQAAYNFNIEAHVLDAHPRSPCSSVTKHFMVGDIADFDTVYQFGKELDLVTIEIEHVNTDALKKLVEDGVKVHPRPEIIEMIQNKVAQKNFFKKNEISTAKFKSYDNIEQLRKDDVKFPFVQKIAKGGYDGRGVKIIRTKEQLEEAFVDSCVVEELLGIETEVSVIVARNPSGDIKVYDPVEMVFNSKENILDYLLAPARLDESMLARLKETSTQIVEQLEMVGLLAIEFIIDKDKRLLVNEMAPRPHNSGHHSIEACVTSQYEQHLRAINNNPLGSTELRLPAAMINIIGSGYKSGQPIVIGLEEIMQEKDIHWHWYAKEETKPGRKMGHITILAADHATLEKKIEQIKEKVRVTA